VVEEHEQGTNTFSYGGDFGETFNHTFYFQPKRNAYFLEDKLEFID